MKKALRLVALFGLVVGLMPSFAAMAQYNSTNDNDKSRIYWNNDRPYTYDTEHHRHYMTVDQAQGWYQQHDPKYWREHQSDWRSSNYNSWDRDWRQYHNVHHGTGTEGQ